MDPALLDTDMVSEIIKLRDPTVRQKALDYTQLHGQLAFSAMTRYEVVRGYRGEIAQNGGGCVQTPRGGLGYARKIAYHRLLWIPSSSFPTIPNHSPATRPTLPLPPAIAETFGYHGDARYVSFYWIPHGDEVVFDDGRSSGTGASYAFLAYRRHAAAAPILESYNLGYSDLEAEHCLLIDRDEDRATIAPFAEAQAFLRDQHPPPPELTPYEREEAERHVQELIDAGWREVQIDPGVVRKAMQAQRQAIARMLAFLDQWPHS